MIKYRREESKLKRKLMRTPVPSIEEYIKAPSVRRLNTVCVTTGTHNQDLLKKIYDFEYDLHKDHTEPAAWPREACVWKIKDKDFLLKVYQKESAVRVKRRIIRQNKVVDFPNLYKWILGNEVNTEILKYVTNKVKKVPNTIRIMFGL